MQNNIFLLSDASYTETTKVAGIGIIDTHTQKEYCFTLNNISSSREAQYRALLCCINIAIKNHYQNVVFGYDYKDLNLDDLKQHIKGKFQCAQFLWLKRGHLKNPDNVAIKPLPQEQYSDTNLLSDFDIYEKFTKYSSTRIIRSFTAIANREQKVFLMTYLRNKEYVPIAIKDENITFYKTIYHLLESESSERFLKFVESHYGGLLEQQNFMQPSDRDQYIKDIKYVLKTIQTKRERVMKSISKYFADDTSMIAV